MPQIQKNKIKMPKINVLFIYLFLFSSTAQIYNKKMKVPNIIKKNICKYIADISTNYIYHIY